MKGDDPEVTAKRITLALNALQQTSMPLPLFNQGILPEDGFVKAVSRTGTG
ncbi:MAG TPA: hypothetical protein VK968_19450 [Roseimicrobium sp.]|nr:hypothetical protein [Roseimicrobium sp.]